MVDALRKALKNPSFMKTIRERAKKIREADFAMLDKAKKAKVAKKRKTKKAMTKKVGKAEIKKKISELCNLSKKM